MDKPSDAFNPPPPRHSHHERNQSRPNHHLPISNPTIRLLPFGKTTTISELPMDKPSDKLKMLKIRKKGERRRLSSSIKLIDPFQFPVLRKKERKEITLRLPHCGMRPYPNINLLAIDQTTSGKKNHQLFGIIQFQNMNRVQNEVLPVSRL